MFGVAFINGGAGGLGGGCNMTGFGGLVVVVQMVAQPVVVVVDIRWRSILQLAY